MIRRPPRSTLSSSSAASDVYKRQDYDQLTAVSFYEKPLLKFERLLETYHAFAPKGLYSFISAISVWIKEKLFMKKLLQDQLRPVSYTHLRAHETRHDLVCRL